MLLVYLCVLSSDVYLYFRILMYVKRHEKFEIRCSAILNKIHYYIIIINKNCSIIYNTHLKCLKCLHSRVVNVSKNR